MSKRMNVNVPKNKKQKPTELKQEKRKANAMAFGVCLVGLVITVIILGVVDAYRAYHYTEAITPEEYKIVHIKKATATQTHPGGSSTERDIYLIKVTYEVDGKSYSDTIQMQAHTDQSEALYWAYMNHDHPENKLGTIYYNAQNPAYISILN